MDDAYMIDFNNERKSMKEKHLKLVSAKQLAKMLSLSVRTVWRLRSAGKLPLPLTVGSSCRWRVSDIEKWVRLNCPDMKTFKIMIGGERE